jgi:hypothetical protein
MADVFLSYSRQDKTRAALFVELLESQGWDVFWDQETRAGTTWPKVLEDELNQARCLIVLWTATSVASRWVRIEAYEALQNDKLLPVRLEAVKPPMEFRQTQTYDLIGWEGVREDPRLPHLFADLSAITKIQPRNRPAAPPTAVPVQTTEPATDAAVPAASEQVALNAAAGVDEPSPSKSARRSRLWWGLGLAAAVLGVVWIMRAVVVPSSEQPGAALKPPIATQPQEKSPASAVAETAPAPQVSPPAPAPVADRAPRAAVKPQRGLPARCIEIAEKFQTTGQLTDEERRFLSSKECAR